MTKRKKTILIILFILIATIVLIVINIASKNEGTSITYTEAQELIVNEIVDKVEVKAGKNVAILYNNLNKLNPEVYNTNIPSIEAFTEFMEEQRKEGNEITYNVIKSSIFNSTFITISLNIIFVIVMVYMFRKIIPKNKIQENYTVSSKTTFSDVAGLEQEKYEVEEVVKFLNNPDKYKELGARPIKGILLRGDPGTGKTLIAKAIAGEAKVPFYACSGSNFDNMYVGVGASKVREIFGKAKKTSPSIIFIDEFDTVARRRYEEGEHNEQTLNQLLSEMDGIDDESNVVVIAATNYYDVLDPAITRPGRFDRIIDIPMPDKKAREEILKVHSLNKKFGEDKEQIISELALKTAGMSGAYLENILNEAAIIAIRNDHKAINREDVDEAFIKIILGISKEGKEISHEEKYLTAIHEAGHAICNRITRPDIKILQVSIVPRGNAGGYTLHEDNKKGILQKQDFKNEIIINLGGRAAEQIIFKTISSGASLDLKQATQIAHNMVYRYGMGESTQLVRIYGESEYNEKLEEKMLPDMENIIQECYEKTLKIIESNIDTLNAIANELMKNSTIDSEKIEEIFSHFEI